MLIKMPLTTVLWASQTIKGLGTEASLTEKYSRNLACTSEQISSDCSISSLSHHEGGVQVTGPNRSVRCISACSEKEMTSMEVFTTLAKSLCDSSK